jgi:hypothetical protein
MQNVQASEEDTGGHSQGYDVAFEKDIISREAQKA